ncbi:MAG: hypothetical protein KDE27_08930, partial [Planctomycetes bacterium]|nr:hypothetical protein [Planctomycetota bacterium]
MSPRPRSTRRTVAAVLLAAVLAAPGPSQQEPSRQEPAPTQTPQQPAKQEPAKPESAQQHPAEPIDPTRAAAEILKQRLGLQPGPIGDPPKGPPAPDYHPTEVAPARSPQEPEPIAPGAPGTAPQGEP